MKTIKITLRIHSIKEEEIECFLSDGKETISAIFQPVEGELVILGVSCLSEIVRSIQLQVVKVLKSATKGKLVEGQIVHCVFIENFRFLKESDFLYYILVDRRNNGLEISVNETTMEGSHKIYADGSYVSEKKQSGYGGFIEDPEGRQQIFFRSFCNGNSNLMELLAVTEGLQRLATTQKIQVNTDSRFVIRGLAQWVHFWKHNNWETAYGREVKFSNYWQQIDQLCHGKCIEFKWVKGHSGHEKQDFCHQLASECAQNSEGTSGNL